ncbi:MAG TPA: SUMF1/EgtB/PvdO family nonheme iron enzyme [Candidatus Saccharimonadales bacterium]|nr:SUMF1/EgtB/PvdO family nonheme iron enzyme [Candidatus Saccharimonadales bacterium]
MRTWPRLSSGVLGLLLALLASSCGGGNPFRPQLLRAHAGGPYAGTYGVPIAFDGRGSTPSSGGRIASYVWSFGDGAWGTGATPSHAYLRPGTYRVALTVAGSGGGASSDSTTAAVDVPAADRMVAVPAGGFFMGSPPGETGHDTSETRHLVTLTHPFSLGRYEVTQERWQALMGWNESDFSGADRPVDEVTWYDAVDFCNRRSAAEGLPPAYALSGVYRSGNHILLAQVAWDRSADGYRLPTEAEWEYACRAGSTTAFANGGAMVWAGRIAPEGCWSDSVLDAIGWYCGDAPGGTRPVGGKAANAWGLYDMHGNVWEWCWDWAWAYPPGAATDPTGPDTGEFRVRRSGAWDRGSSACRSASRYYGAPGFHYVAYGLRVARGAWAPPGAARREAARAAPRPGLAGPAGVQRRAAGPSRVRRTSGV